MRLLTAVVMVALLLSGWTFEAHARSSKRASNSRSRHAALRSTRSASSSRSSRISGSSRGPRRARGGRSRGRATPTSQHKNRPAAPQQHGPSAAQIKRQETSGANDLEKRTDLERSYRTYDQGLSEWMAGNYSQAAKYLNESYELYSDFHGSHDVLDSLYLYDLGQAAEAAGDFELAKNSYQRSLRRQPDFSDCCIRLTGLLTKSGQTALALVYARRLADKNPQDPRAQFLLSTMLDKAGFPEEGKAARENFNLLMRGGKVAKPQNQVEQGDRDAESGRSGAENPGGAAVGDKEKVLKDEADTESGAAKNSGATDKQDSESVKKPDSESQSK